MENHNTSERNYAYLPDDLISKILNEVPKTVDKMNKMFDIQEKPIKEGIDHLRKQGMIETLKTKKYSGSLIAVDGGNIVDKMTGTDLLLAVAAGVEGLSEDKSIDWGDEGNQFYQWQTVVPHDEANSRLCQGIMFLMELSVLANAEHEIRIMDGTHFTPIIKINSLLSAFDDRVGLEYVQALRQFLKDTYEKIIPDIPDIIKAAFNDDKIIALAKYSSSRDVIEAYLKKYKINLDDKTFFTLALNEDEYLIPMSVGQSADERDRIWDELRIKCNLKIPKVELNKLNEKLIEAINPIRTKCYHTHKPKESTIYYTYYKPYQAGPAYKIEMKKSLATDKTRFEACLLSIKKQIIFPEIREPYPQYLVDLMAKSIAGGLFSIKEAIKLSPDFKIDKSNFNLIFNYRT